MRSRWCNVALTIILLLMLSKIIAWTDWVQDGDVLNVTGGAYAYNPSIADNDGMPIIAWPEGSSNSNLYIKYWDGNNWRQMGGSLNIKTAGGPANASITMNNSVPYVAWEEFSNTSTSESQVVVKHWTGSAWVQDGNSLNSDPNRAAGGPSIAATNGMVFVAYLDLSDQGIYIKHWDGSKWLSDSTGSLNVDPLATVNKPALVLDTNNIYVAWAEVYNSKFQIFVKHFSGGYWIQNGGSLNFNDAGGSAQYPCIAIKGGVPYVAWSEFDGVANQIYVKHWNGSEWVKDGGSLNVDPSKNANAPSLIINDGSPFISWTEYLGSVRQVYVKYWDGNAWIQVGGNLNYNSSQDAAVSRMTSCKNMAYVAWTEKNITTNQLRVKHYMFPTPVVTSTPLITPTNISTMVPGAFFKIINGKINPGKNEKMTISWSQPTEAETTISIYNMLGDKIITLVNHQLFSAGQLHKESWDGTAASGKPVGNGIYTVYFKSDGYETHGKCAVVK
jgi:flagellar hook assembly protein FlgD